MAKRQSDVEMAIQKLFATPGGTTTVYLLEEKGGGAEWKLRKPWEPIEAGEVVASLTITGLPAAEKDAFFHRARRVMAALVHHAIEKKAWANSSNRNKG